MNSKRERIIREVFHKPKDISQGSHQRVNSNEVNPEVNPELLKMFPPEKIERIKAKALRRYKHRQDIQWEKYLESMNK